MRAGCSEGATKPGWLTGELSAVLGRPGLCHEVGWYLMLRLKAEGERSRQCLSSLGRGGRQRMNGRVNE